MPPSTSSLRRLALALLAALVASWAAPAQARELDWRAVEVAARLDAAGRLHVSERHQLVFTGDWNGAERRFRAEPGQAIELVSLTRIEADDTQVPLLDGDLGLFDHYRWSADERLLRWRIRRQSDGTFDHSEFVYRIDYALRGVLDAEADGSYRMAHDFAFEHEGTIGRLRLRLVLDESWSTSQPSPIQLEQTGLSPGERAVLTLSLQHSGPQRVETTVAPATAAPTSAAPAAAPRLRTEGRLSAAGVFLLAAVALVQLLFWRARRLGRFEPPPREADIDRRWLEEHVLVHKPELVGAAFDRKIGSDEVTAVLARLEREGRLSSKLSHAPANAGKGQIELELRVPREAFTGYERLLIDKLFFAGDRTSKELIRDHFASFDPSSALERPMTEALRDVLGPGRGPEDGHMKLASGLALVSGWALQDSSVECVLEARPSWSGDLLDMLTVVGLALWFLCGVWAATSFRDHAEPQGDARLLRGWFAITSFVVVALALLPGDMPPLALALHFGGSIGFMGVIAWAGWPREHAAGVLLRKRIAAARLYFQAQLRKERPDLDDRWYPYLVALGLVPEMDAWSHDHRVAPQDEEEQDAWIDGRRGPSQPKEDEAQPWTGGGGAFGGGGASGSWGGAASELASGVASSETSAASSSDTSSSPSSELSEPSLSSDSPSRSGGGSAGGW